MIDGSYTVKKLKGYKGTPSSSYNIDNLGRFYRCKVDSTGYTPVGKLIREFKKAGIAEDFRRMSYIPTIDSSSGIIDTDVPVAAFNVKDVDSLERDLLIRERIKKYNSTVDTLFRKYNTRSDDYFSRKSSKDNTVNDSEQNKAGS